MGEHNMAFELRTLGKTSIKLTALGLGAWQFSQGQGLVGGFWPTLDDELIAQIVQEAWMGGIRWFDTAEIYGHGASEGALSKALKTLQISSDEVMIATKWWPLGRTYRSLGASVPRRLQSLQGYPITLYQIHQPWALSSLKAQAEALIHLLREKLVYAAGVSNFSAPAMREMAHRLNDAGFPLASNQMRFNLLDRSIEKNGVLNEAENLGVAIIAYSPLQQGLLSGKFHQAGTHPTGFRRWSPYMSKKYLARTRPLIDLLGEMGQRYHKTAAQVSLNWIISAHPQMLAIPGATKPEQARQLADTLSFRLSEDEYQTLTNLSDKIISKSRK